jgi:PKD repeat protein
MDGGASQVYNWTGSLAAGATSTITLNNFTGLTAAAHTFSATVSAPNGGADGFAGNNTLTSNFTVTTAPAGAALPFTEGFETATFAPTGWSYTPVDATNRWTRIAHTFGLTAGSTGCAKMDNFSTGTIDPTGQRDALQTPALSFAAANSTLQVQFDVAHRQYNTTYIDSLNVWISTDCGGTWTRVYNKGGASLATVTPTSTAAFTPTANGNWRRETVSLSAYAGQPVVYVKFESVSGWGNNLFLDNINISYTPAAAPPVANFTAAATKCAGSAISFTDASTNAPTAWAWTTTPTTGVTITSPNSQNPSITFATAGTYTVSLAATNGNGTSPSYTQAVVVNAAPTMTSATTANVCSGIAANVALTSSIPSSYSWIAATNAQVTGESLTAQTTATINNVLTNTTTATQTVTYSVTPTATTGGCVGPVQTVSVTVIPAPAMTNATTASVCSGTPLAIALTSNIPSSYSWIAANSANVTGETTTATVSGTINNTLGNTSGVPRTVTYSVTPTSTTGSCVGATQVVTVTVNILPTVTSTSTPAGGTVCSGASVTLNGGGANTYAWTGGVTNATAFTATATTTYTVTGTTTATGCSNTATRTITVNPLPSMTSATTANVCSGIAVNVPLTSSIPSSYSWIAATNAQVTGESLTAQTTGTINNVLTNTTTTTQTVTYSVTPTATTGGCVGAVQTISVTVVPAPTMTSATTASVCSGTPLAIALTSNIPSSYSWIAANSTQVTGESTTAQAGATINNTLGNTSGAPRTVTYSVTPTSTTGSCVGAVQTVSVTVNILPTVTATSAPVSGTVCSGASVTLNGGGANTYTWTGGVTNGTAFTATATTTYTVTGTTTATGCSNTAN